jgi:hypothetical protein
MAEGRAKRIVFEASPEVTAALEATAGRLGLSKIGTLRLAVAILAEITNQLTRGGKLILRDEDGGEREIWLPQLNLGPRHDASGPDASR